MSRTGDVTVALLAKAPVAGFAKTRLIPVLGGHGAAVLQERLTARAVATACAAAVGPVVLWATPDPAHAAFRDLARAHPIRLARQPDGDLGARMLAAVAAAAGPVLVIGTDCPVLSPAHLRSAARSLRDDDAVVLPAEDGGYALIGLRAPRPELFAGVAWGTDQVMDETRRRLREWRLSWREPARLWDLDRPGDLERMEREGIDLLD